VDEDDVDADELSPAPDLLGRHLADMGDELQLQVARQRASAARAHVGRDELSLGVERLVHGDRSLGRRGDGGGAFQRSGVSREERGVALDLDQVEAAGSIDDRLQQASGGCLRMSETRPVEAHVVGVAADVGDHEESPVRVHRQRS
jgi:hypothetical protein